MPNATSALMDLLERSDNVFRSFYHFPPPGFGDYDVAALWQDAKQSLADFRRPSEEQLEQGAEDALRIVKALCHYWAADGLAMDLLSSWRRYEDLVYFSSRDYRDHFLHQFYVFLVGLAFL